jgi:hypothetical protein
VWRAWRPFGLARRNGVHGLTPMGHPNPAATGFVLSTFYTPATTHLLLATTHNPQGRTSSTTAACPLAATTKARYSWWLPPVS